MSEHSRHCEGDLCARCADAISRAEDDPDPDGSLADLAADRAEDSYWRANER